VSPPRFCGSCGSLVPAGDRFCSTCGRPVSVVQPPTGGSSSFPTPSPNTVSEQIVFENELGRITDRRLVFESGGRGGSRTRRDIPLRSISSVEYVVVTHPILSVVFALVGIVLLSRGFEGIDDRYDCLVRQPRSVGPHVDHGHGALHLEPRNQLSMRNAVAGFPPVVMTRFAMSLIERR
jgi:hypothetical protein